MSEKFVSQWCLVVLLHMEQYLKNSVENSEEYTALIKQSILFLAKTQNGSQFHLNVENRIVWGRTVLLRATIYK